MKKFTIVFLTLIAGVFLTAESDAATRAGLAKKQCPKGTVTVIIENIPRCVDKQDHIEYLKEQEEKYRKASEAEQAAADAIGIEIRGVEQETAQTEAALPGAIQKREDAWLAAKDSLDHFDEKIAPIRNQKTETVGGLPLGSLKDGLNDAAGNLENLKGRLRGMGWKEEDIQKLVDYVGVDPERLARAVREVADSVQPQMDMKDLYRLKEKLESRLDEVKADEAKIKNTAAKERAELARYDADIAKAKGEKNASNQSRMDHDKLADGYDAECKRDWVTCAWNIPKALWERSMAALDQANMNRIDAWIGLLNFGKAWPSMVVAGSDLKAVPFTGMRQLIEKQLADVEKARTDLQAKIDREAGKASGELNKEYKSLKAEHEKAKKEVERLEGNLISLPVKKEVLVAKKTERENEATRLRLIAEGFRSQLAGFGVKVEAATSVAGASRSTQSLPASPGDFEKRIQQAEMQSREAKNKMIAAEQRYQSKLEQVKRGEGIDTGRKPLPALDRPAVVKPIGGRDWEQEWQTIQRQEAAALAQHQRRLEEGKAAFERHYALEKKPHDLKLAEKDQEVEEAKRKVAEAEAALKKALAEAEGKKAAPVITKVPATANTEENVAIYGKNFIRIDGKAVQFNVKDVFWVKDNSEIKAQGMSTIGNPGEDDRINVKAPQEAGNYALKVVTAKGSALWDKPLVSILKKAPPVPVITAVPKTEVEPEEIVTIYGKNFIIREAGKFKSFNFKQLSFVQGKTEKEAIVNVGQNRGDEESVFFMVPEEAGAYSLKIIANSGEIVTWNNPPLTVISLGPVISKAPAIAEAEENVVIYGKNFIRIGAKTERFNVKDVFWVKEGKEMKAQGQSVVGNAGEEDKINVKAPDEIGNYALKVITAKGTALWDKPLITVGENKKKKEAEELAKKEEAKKQEDLRQAQVAAEKQRKLAEEEAAKKKAQEELALKKEAEKQEAERQRKLAEEEAKKKAQEELARKQEEERQKGIQEAMRQRQAEEEAEKQRKIEQEWGPPPTPSEEDQGPETTDQGPTRGEEPEVVRQEPESEEAPPQCERGTWSPTFGRCIEDEPVEQEARPDCPGGTHWSPTLRSCQPD